MHIVLSAFLFRCVKLIKIPEKRYFLSCRNQSIEDWFLTDENWRRSSIFIAKEAWNKLIYCSYCIADCDETNNEKCVLGQKMSLKIRESVWTQRCGFRICCSYFIYFFHLLNNIRKDDGFPKQLCKEKLVFQIFQVNILVWNCCFLQLTHFSPVLHLI